MMIFHISQQEHQVSEDHSTNLLEAKGTLALLLMFGELDTACSFSIMKSYPSMENHNSSAI